MSSLYQIRSNNGDFTVMKFYEDFNFIENYKLNYNGKRMIC